MVAEQPLIVPTLARKRLSYADAEQIAELVVKYRLNESEACLHLNIQPKRWFNWKLEHKREQQYTDIITRIRGGQLVNVIQAIDKAGDGIGMKQPDWRAKAWIAERVLAPERLSDRQQQAQATVPQLTDFVKALAVFMQSKDKLAQVVDVQPVKQITEQCSNDTQLNTTNTAT